MAYRLGDNGDGLSLTDFFSSGGPGADLNVASPDAVYNFPGGENPPGTEVIPTPGFFSGGSSDPLTGAAAFVRSLFPAGLFVPTGARVSAVTPYGQVVTSDGVNPSALTASPYFVPLAVAGGLLVLLMVVRRR